MSRTRFRLFAAAAAILFFIVAFLYALTRLPMTVRKYTLYDERIENPVRLLMISDLHRSEYGEDQEDLIDAVRRAEPDAVLLCGDIFDEHGRYEIAQPLLRAIGELYPCYFVSGNHEYGVETPMPLIEKGRTMLEESGITVLDGGTALHKIGETTVRISAIEDENRYTVYHPEDEKYLDRSFTADFRELSAKNDGEYFSLILCHRPRPDLAEESSFDLMLSGHCHGGQWRFPPFVNGLFAPNQGLFPRYAGGKYRLGKCTMIVGRGLATENGIPRFCNPPEVVVIDLLPA